MRITLTVQRAGAGPTDLEVTADATATVADLAEALLRADPLHPQDPPPEQATLQVGDAPEAGGRGTRTLARDQDLIQAGLRSGSTVRLVPAPAPGDPLDDAERDGAVALLRVLSGPEAGREIPLGSGSHVIGREGELDVRLADPQLSRRHARLNLGEVVEIIDLDSTHGLHHGERRVPRVVLGPADTVRIGGSTLAVIPLQRVGGLDPTAPVLEINRSPRVVPRFPPRSLRAPTPPREPAPTVFPIFMLFAPLLMGAFLFGLTRSPFALVFVVMMPMMAVAGYLNRRYQQRRTLEQQIETFERALAALTRRLAAAQEIERAVRDVEAPSTAQAVDAALRMGPLLWTHRPEHPAFATLRLGLGIAPSRVGIEAPSEMGTLPEYQDLLDQVQEDYRDVAGVPVVADLREAGNLGLAGSGEDADGAARGLVLQLCALHSPAELVLAALVPPRGLGRWGWLPWLPHTASPHSPLPGEHLADSAAAGGALLGRLEDLLAERGGGPARPRPPIPETRPGEGEEPPAPVLPTVVVLVEDDAPVDRARLVRLAERGPDVGVHLIWHAPTPADLPAACRTTLDLSAPRPVPETPGAAATGEGTTVAGHVRRGERFAPVSVETLDAAAAATTARRLAPMVDAGVPLGDDSDLPRSIGLLALTGPAPAADPGAVARAWTGTGTDAAPGDISPGDTVPADPARDGLGALVGHDGQHPFRLDLRRQGPHALVGGTTGSGKSEFLQSWVLGMAAAHSPSRVCFLFVDYKGGAAFADCVRLPHAVGLVTDLSPHLVRRALTSLRAELRQREHLLQRKGAKDLLTLERRGDPDCPPSLVVVVDEFAALATEIPEFVDGMVDIAARGRSLGLHLILATQRPAGVIKDSLRANTNLRIALRTADAEDSTDILGDRMAAHIDPDLPGRAVAASGPGRLVPFQAAYAGGHTGADGQRPDLDIVERPFSRGRAWEQPAPTARPGGPPDITRIVATLTTAARHAELPPPRRPWLPELAARYDLARLPSTRRDEELLLGVQDLPREQEQPTVAYRPDRDGTLAILGTGGSGKSTALRTLAISAASTVRGGPVHVYGLDHGAGGLRLLEELPHVGAIIDDDDEERTVRLLRTLRGVVEERARDFARLRAGSLDRYRELAGAPDTPRILLLVDGFGALRESLDTPALAPWMTVLGQIATDGRQVGVHLVLSADRAGAVPTAMASTIQHRLVLRMAGADEYAVLGEPRDVLGPASPPGRGLLAGSEVQVAVHGGDGDLAVQAQAVSALAGAMRRAGVAEAPPVRRLPEHVPASALARARDGCPVLGLADEDLDELTTIPRGAFLISGPPGAGRSTAVLTLATHLRALPGPRRLVRFSGRRTTLSGRELWDLESSEPEEVAELAAQLRASIDAGAVGDDRLALVLDGLAEFAGTRAERELEPLIRACVREGLFVIAESESSTWSQAYQLARPFKSGRRGLLLHPAENEGDSLLGTPTGRLRRTDLPPGRGVLIGGGRSRLLQVAHTP
ncbi:FtsK/SpoIIIE domain-containing protein [Brachybacterium squillarum]|uniref:FtsK/SpoIIIE domain-containing protein n=1 Tax=Brachybacterium squillarum TaxID=661979 RepID=UPI0002629E9B|nr:FtsK/SpoIIIE domain-containing protein [Brachybacterium squillarum]